MSDPELPQAPQLDSAQPEEPKWDGQFLSLEALTYLQFFCETLQNQTLSDIRDLFTAKGLTQKNSIGAITIGWEGDTIVRLVTKDRQLVQIAIGRAADFAVNVLCADVDSQSTEAWSNLLSMERAQTALKEGGNPIPLPEMMTLEARKIHVMTDS